MKNLKFEVPANQNIVSLSHEWEVKFWMQKLNVSATVLSEAVRESGNSVDNVKRYLKIFYQ